MAPRRPRDGPKRGNTNRQIELSAPRGPQEAPRGPQEAPGPQETPKKPPRGSREAAKSRITAPNRQRNGPQEPRGFGTASRRPSSLEPRETYHLPRDPNELSRCFHEDESQTPRRFQSSRAAQDPRPKTQDGTKNIKGAEKGRLKGPRDHKEGFKGQASRGRVADGKGGE